MPLNPPVVEMVDAVFRYGARVAIDRSSCLIPAAAVTAVIGPNGSGKSTLLNAVAGLVEPAEGTLQVHVSSRSVAYVLQTTKVNETLPVTVREVVTMGRYATTGAWGRLTAADRTAIAEAMTRMQVIDLADRHLSELSGGQRQRVFVAQGLAQDHELLLLDEPLTGLDLLSAQAIDDVIHDEEARGRTVVMTTHDVAEARAADHVVLLAGRVVASGPPHEVLAVENLMAAYGAGLLHVEGEPLFVDDPAHRPASERHVHRDRSIHVESSSEDTHGGGAG